MWTRKYLYGSLLSLLLCFVQPISGQASPVYSVTADQLMTLESHLNELEKNNQALLTILNESGGDLTEALNRLALSKLELAKLKAELTQAKIESEKALISLQIANQELTLASESLKKSEQVKNRIERQRNFWEVIAVIATGIAITR